MWFDNVWIMMIRIILGYLIVEIDWINKLVEAL